MTAKLKERLAEITDEYQKHRARGREILESVGEAKDYTQEKRDEIAQINARMTELEKEKEDLSDGVGFAAKLDEGDAQDKKAREAAVRQARIPVHGSDGDGGGLATDEKGWVLTPGASFARSAAYAEWVQKFGDRGPQDGEQYTGPPAAAANMRQALGLWTIEERAAGRQLVTAGDVESGGAVLRPDYRGLLDPFPAFRELSALNLLTVMPSGEGLAVEYVRQLAQNLGADMVPEATAATGTSGTKPEAGFTLQLVREAMGVVAGHVPATTRILSRAPGLRNYIDTFLTYDVRQKLEAQALTGDGTGDNLNGIIPQVPAGNQAAPLAGPFYSLRRAIRLVRVNGKTSPSAILLHPEDGEDLDLIVVNAEVNRFVGPGPYGQMGNRIVWGRPVIESEALTVNQALVGDFRFAILFMGEDTEIRVGTINDDFTRNILRILAELMALVAVIRPAAFATAVV